MTDTGGPPGGDDPWRRKITDEIGGFCRKSSYWAAGGMAAYLRYRGIRDLSKMMGGNPAARRYLLITNLLALGVYSYSRRQIQNNAKDAAKNLKDHYDLQKKQ